MSARLEAMQNRKRRRDSQGVVGGAAVGAPAHGGVRWRGCLQGAWRCSFVLFAAPYSYESLVVYSSRRSSPRLRPFDCESRASSNWENIHRINTYLRKQPASGGYVSEIFHLLDVDDSGVLTREEFSSEVKILYSQVFTRMIVQWSLTLLSEFFFQLGSLWIRTHVSPDIPEQALRKLNAHPAH